jgi:hypothetical protein
VRFTEVSPANETHSGVITLVNGNLVLVLVLDEVEVEVEDEVEIVMYL